MLEEGSRIKVLVGGYRGRSGTVEVLAEDSPKKFGVKVDPEKGDKMLMPLVWFKPVEIEREDK